VRLRHHPPDTRPIALADTLTKSGTSPCRITDSQSLPESPIEITRTDVSAERLCVLSGRSSNGVVVRRLSAIALSASYSYAVQCCGVLGRTAVQQPARRTPLNRTALHRWCKFKQRRVKLCRHPLQQKSPASYSRGTLRSGRSSASISSPCLPFAAISGPPNSALLVVAGPGAALKSARLILDPDHDGAADPVAAAASAD
jgi:hypothetical protein